VLGTIEVHTASERLTIEVIQRSGAVADGCVETRGGSTGPDAFLNN
jgi:hypothetical protein